MSALTIRGLDPEVKGRLRVRAAQHGRSMEEEVRVILKDAVAARAEPVASLAETIHRRFAAVGGVELELPPRELLREPPRLR
jgi:plasmid stability protein